MFILNDKIFFFNCVKKNNYKIKFFFLIIRNTYLSNLNFAKNKFILLIGC